MNHPRALPPAPEALSLFRGKRQVAYTKTPDGMVSVELTSPLG